MFLIYPSSKSTNLIFELLYKFWIFKNTLETPPIPLNGKYRRIIEFLEILFLFKILQLLYTGYHLNRQIIGVILLAPQELNLKNLNSCLQRLKYHS